MLFILILPFSSRKVEAKDPKMEDAPDAGVDKSKEIPDKSKEIPDKSKEIPDKS